ncbi:MAG: hypothetical protein BGN86_09675 [Caulobacterales bacterium 68-7]|nr:MAG: hypothetical protein BGN86_09675 [Caulobacterales bacterium 68-7]
MQVRTGLGVHGENVGARLAIGLEVGIDRGDHQVHVDRDLHVWLQRLHHHRADGDVGHEVAVHDVDVQPVGAGGLHGPNLFPEAREIRRQDGGGDDRAVGAAGQGHEGFLT